MSLRTSPTRTTSARICFWISGTAARLTTVPSVCTPPWAGGESFRERGPRREPPLHQQLHPPRAATWNHMTQRAHLPRAKTTDSGTGTSASCSTGSWSRRTARCGVPSSRVMNLSRPCKTNTSWPTTCGTGTSSSGTTGTQSPICSTVCRCTAPAAQTRKTTGLAGSACRLGRGFARVVAVKCTSLSSSQALAVFCPRKAE